MELMITEGTLSELMEELQFQQKKYPNAVLKGRGDGNVMIQLNEDRLFTLVNTQLKSK